MNYYLIPGLELSPTVLGRLLERIPANRLDSAVAPGRFTPREVIAHLADWEPIMRDRIGTAVEQPGSDLQVFDEGEMAIQKRYADSDPEEQLAIFKRERAETIALVRSIQPEQWLRTANHPERGPQSADDLANLLLGHDLYHIEQLTASLAP